MAGPPAVSSAPVCTARLVTGWSVSSAGEAGLGLTVRDVRRITSSRLALRLRPVSRVTATLPAPQEVSVTRPASVPAGRGSPASSATPALRTAGTSPPAGPASVSPPGAGTTRATAGRTRAAVSANSSSPGRTVTSVSRDISRSQRRTSSGAAPASVTVTPLSVAWLLVMFKVSREEPPALHFLTELIAAAIKSQFLRGPDDWTAEENGRNIRDRTIFNAYKKIIGKKRETLENLCELNVCQVCSLWRLRLTLWLRRNFLVTSWPATARN